MHIHIYKFPLHQTKYLTTPLPIKTHHSPHHTTSKIHPTLKHKTTLPIHYTTHTPPPTPKITLQFPKIHTIYPTTHHPPHKTTSPLIHTQTIHPLPHPLFLLLFPPHPLTKNPTPSTNKSTNPPTFFPLHTPPPPTPHHTPLPLHLSPTYLKTKTPPPPPPPPPHFSITHHPPLLPYRILIFTPIDIPHSPLHSLLPTLFFPPPTISLSSPTYSKIYPIS